MSKLYDELKAALGLGMVVPEAFRLLYDWIEERGLYDGRVGRLFSLEELKASAPGTNLGGTYIELSAEYNQYLHDWFGHKKREVLDRVCVFARSGDEGSMAGFWMDDEGRQVIVHMGSGSGMCWGASRTGNRLGCRMLGCRERGRILRAPLRLVCSWKWY